MTVTTPTFTPQGNLRCCSECPRAYPDCKGPCPTSATYARIAATEVSK